MFLPNIYFLDKLNFFEIGFWFQNTSPPKLGPICRPAGFITFVWRQKTVCGRGGNTWDSPLLSLWSGSGDSMWCVTPGDGWCFGQPTSHTLIRLTTHHLHVGLVVSFDIGILWPVTCYCTHTIVHSTNILICRANKLSPDTSEPTHRCLVADWNI